MGKAQETSLLFSLESLMREERGRVEREREEELERNRRRERERAEAAERLARQREEAARLREREIAERAQTEREEQARLAAIREGEIERVRLDAEARASQEVRAREMAHQVELERTRAVTRTNVRRLALVTTGVLAIGTAFGAIALHFGQSEDGGAGSEDARASEIRTERERLARMETSLKSERQRLDDALRELRTRPAPATPSTTAEGASPQRPRPGAPASRPASRSGPAENKRPCRGDPNDPLNPCLNP